MRGTRQNVHDAHKSGKPDPRNKKSTMLGVIKQNILETRELRKCGLNNKKLVTVRGTRQNVPKSNKLGKLEAIRKNLSWR